MQLRLYSKDKVLSSDYFRLPSVNLKLSFQTTQSEISLVSSVAYLIRFESFDCNKRMKNLFRKVFVYA